jgi:hypothetical protein
MIETKKNTKGQEYNLETKYILKKVKNVFLSQLWCVIRKPWQILAVLNCSNCSPDLIELQETVKTTTRKEYLARHEKIRLQHEQTPYLRKKPNNISH